MQGVTGVKVVSLHHDISTLTGEEVVLFTLIEPPSFARRRRKNDAAAEPDPSVAVVDITV